LFSGSFVLVLIWSILILTGTVLIFVLARTTFIFIILSRTTFILIILGRITFILVILGRTSFIFVRIVFVLILTRSRFISVFLFIILLSGCFVVAVFAGAPIGFIVLTIAFPSSSYHVHCQRVGLAIIYPIVYLYDHFEPAFTTGIGNDTVVR